MGCWSKWDIGGCGCGCATLPCALPASALTLGYSLTGGITTGSVTLPYSGSCVWNSGCVVATAGPPVGRSIRFTIQIVAGVTQYQVERFSDNGCGTGVYTATYKTSGLSTPGFTLTSYSCSPLSIVLTWSGTFGPDVYTIT
jgi:hypothetical protein